MRHLAHWVLPLLGADRLGATGINAVWLMADKVLKLALGALVLFVSARVLGPEGFGRLSFATALVAVMGSMSTLGANAIVVRELVRRPGDGTRIMEATLLLLLAGGCGGALLSIAAGLALQREDSVTLAATGLLALALVFKASDAFRYWFEARVEARPLVLVDNTVFILAALVKVGTVLWTRSVVALALVSLLEAIATSAALALLYRRRTGVAPLPRGGTRELLGILRQCWPLALSALSVMIYMRLDQLMLAQMAGSGPLGIYSAALRLSELWYFIPMAVSASVYPSLIRLREADGAEYHRRLESLIRKMAGLAVLIAIAVTLLRGPIVGLVYGPAYAEAGAILAVHVWTGVFVCMGVLSSNWYIIEGLQKVALARTLFGAAVNVVLNLVLIPRHGALGAAIATLAAQACAAYLFDCLTPRTRVLFHLKTSALFPWEKKH